MTALEIPDEVVRMNLSANGDAGRAWLGSLPSLVEELTDRWSVAIGPAFTGGAVGFVAPAERSRPRRPSSRTGTSTCGTCSPRSANPGS